MRYYFAPLEGLTDSIFRSLHCKYFPGVHRYYTPFLSPTVHRRLTPRESRELPPADTLPYACVPQLLTKVPEDFLWMAGKCKELGYGEVNLNLGCPSGTVTSKGKGSGMLRDLAELDAFLSEIFQSAPLPISVKTRIGFYSRDEFPAIVEVLNKYPIRELTIHPRIRTEFYNGQVDMDAFRYAVKHCTIPLCYNGNLYTLEHIQAFHQEFPQVNAVMLGRGLVGDPGLLSPGGTTPEALEAFYEELLGQYTAAFGGSRNAMFRLKENWRHLYFKFEGAEKLFKQLRKTTDVQQYRAITKEIFHNCPLRKDLQPDW